MGLDIGHSNNTEDHEEHAAQRRCQLSTATRQGTWGFEFRVKICALRLEFCICFGKQRTPLFPRKTRATHQKNVHI